MGFFFSGMHCIKLSLHVTYLIINTKGQKDCNPFSPWCNQHGQGSLCVRSAGSQSRTLCVLHWLWYLSSSPPGPCRSHRTCGTPNYLLLTRLLMGYNTKRNEVIIIFYHDKAVKLFHFRESHTWQPWIWKIRTNGRKSFWNRDFPELSMHYYSQIFAQIGTHDENDHYYYYYFFFWGGGG